MQRELAALVDRLSHAYGDRLVSVILYGSGAAGNHHGSFSDLNVFCVLTQVTPRELADSEPVFRWWRELGQPSPLLMSEEEARTSTDSFPIEFQDMKERRKVLQGRDIIAEIEVDRRYWRAQLEHELRAKLLRLRQQAAGILSDRDRLLKLCADSVSTFLVLGRHALLYSGAQAPVAKRDIVRDLESALGTELSGFHTLLDVREKRIPPQDVEIATVFDKYLNHVKALVAFVDRLEERKA